MITLKLIGSFLFKWWMAFARLLGRINTAVLLTIVYVLLVGPLWIVMKLKGEDVLDRGLKEGTSYWNEKAPSPQDLPRSRRQF